MSEYALTGDQSRPRAKAASDVLDMDEQKFAAFYERTSRALWMYLRRVTGDPEAASDVAQEAYYRLLRARLPQMNEAELKSYLFRIASNIVRDNWRKQQSSRESAGEAARGARAASTAAPAADVERRSELDQALARLSMRERQLLWLAYVEGSSHKEIADAAGLRANSVRPLLHRARAKLAAALRTLRGEDRSRGGI